MQILLLLHFDYPLQIYQYFSASLEGTLQIEFFSTPMRDRDPPSSDGHLHLKKGSLPNTLPFLRVDCRTNTLYKICLQFLKKGSLPNTLHFKGGRTDTLGQQYFILFGKGWWPLPLPFICQPNSVEKV